MSSAHVPGESVGPWCLDRHLGDGSFGSTWQAHDPVGRTAALKLLRVPPGDELRVLAQLAHPAIPALLGAASHPQPYVAMELAAGRPLEKMLQRGRAPEQAALQICAVLADGLAEVHRAGLSHGDLKPENILVDRISDLRIWIVDFGAAADGSIGTLHYAAPERMHGAHASPESDVYSLGLVLYQMLFGTLPGFDDSISAALMKRRSEPPVVPGGAPWVQALLLRMLDLQPSLRPTAAEVADTLEANGLRLPQPDGTLLRRRARAVHVPPEGFAAFLTGWLDGDGSRAIVGPAHTGRTHALERAVTELQARGSTWLQLANSETPWRSVAEALQTSSLAGAPVDLPAEPEPGLRARLAAEALAQRAQDTLFVLVDDLDGAAETTRATVAALAAIDCVHVLATSTAPVPWAAATHTLGAMSRGDLDTLLASTLGDPAPVGELSSRIETAGAALPGLAIDALADACDAGDLRRRARRWHVDGPAFGERVRALHTRDTVCLVASDPDVTDLAALIAIFGGPVSVERLADIAPLARARFAEALGELTDRGWVRTSGSEVTIDGPRTAAAAEAAARDAADLHVRVLRASTAGELSPLQEVHHLARAGSNRLAAERAEPALRECIAQDPEHAARLATELWAATPLPSIAGSILEALLAGGRATEVRDLGIGLARSPRATRGVLLAMARYHIHVADEPGSALPLLQRARLQPEAGANLDLELLEAQAHFQLGAHADAIEVARTACGRDPGPELAAQEAWVALHGTWAQSLHAHGDIETAITILEGVPASVAAGRPCHALLKGTLGRLFWYAERVRDAATALAEAAADPQLPTLQRARLANNAGVAFYSCGDRLDALERWEHAHDLFCRLESVLEQVRVGNNLCVAYTEAGRWERGKAAGERAFTLAEEREDAVLAAMSAGNLGDLHAAQDDIDTARQWYRTAQGIADTHGVEGEKVELARRMATVAVRRGDADAELRAMAARKLALAAGDEVEAARSELLRLVCRARSPKVQDDLLPALEAVVSGFREKGLAGHIADARAWVAEALLDMGQTEAALKRIEAAELYAEENGLVPLQRRVAALRTRARRDLARDPQLSRFERMLELATRVAREQDPESLLDAIAAAGLELLDGERSFVLLVEGRTSRVVRAIGPHGPLQDPSAKPSQTIIGQALAQKRPVTALDLSERQDLRNAASITLNALRSAMCVPMADGEQLVGLLYVDSTRTTEEQLGEASHLMRALASHAAVAIGHARHLAALEQRAARAAELVHDLRSPLASAASLIEEMRDDTLADGLDPDLHDEALALLHQTMTLAERVLGDEDGADATVVELGSRLTEVGMQLDRYAQRQGRSVLVDIDDTARVLCDPDAFERVVRNLVGNALRFSPDGGTVWLRMAPTVDQVVVTVTDEGDGIPKDLVKRLFQRGAKGDTDQSQHGLGLAIVDRLVSEMGGSVRASNSETAGACFTITLPRVADSGRKTG